MKRIGIAAMGSSPGTGGGVDIYTRGLVEALCKYAPEQRFAVLVGPKDGDTWRYRNWPKNVEFVPVYRVEPNPTRRVFARGLSAVSKGRLGVWSGATYLAKQIDGIGLPVIHFPSTTIQTLSVRTPCVLTCFDVQQEYYPEFFTAKELEHRARTFGPSLEKAERVIAPTEFTQKTLVEKYGLANEKISVVPGGFDSNQLKVSNAEVECVRRKYALPDQFIFYPANPWQHKNHARLMAALRLLRQRHDHAPHLVLSGRLPEERRDAMSLAVAAGVDDLVTDLGFVPSEDLPALYRLATLMVFPSLFEGFGIPLVEAMACGCPIVAADATTIPEITSGAALLFDPMSVEEIACAIEQAWCDQGLRARLVEQGYQQLHRFAWEGVVERLLRIYGKYV